MMAVTIDPSETRSPAPQAARAARPRLRLALLSGLGILGLAGFAALASSMLGGLAGPQYTRPTIRTATLPQQASEWPDLRDGVPALAPMRPAVVGGSESPPAAKPAPERPAAAPVAMPAALAPAVPPVVQAVAQTPVAPTPPPAAPLKRIESAAPKPARIPPIENAAVLPPARPAALVPAARTAALIAPSSTETTRSRADSGTFTALTAEREAPKRIPAVTVAHPKPVAKPVAEKTVAQKPVAAKVASAAPAVAEAEPEHTEVFGIKVPSLAPAGRKLAEGVEALGNAVKSLPDRF